MHLARSAWTVLVILLLAVAPPTGGCAARNASESASAPSSAAFRHAVVAADHALASRAGAEIMREHKGNAVDAAVATAFALSVVRPYSCGIGGGGFMIIHFRDDPRHGTQSIALNYRETAPAAVTEDYFLRLEAAGVAEASTRGGTSVGVPGTVAGLLYALERYGTLDRPTVLAPAIELAENGFVVDAHYVENTRNLIDWFNKDPRRQTRYRFTWDRYLNGGNVAVGDRIALPEQAAALRLIAERGASAFYEGPIAEAILAAVRADGGGMSADDLRGFRVDHATPLTFGALGRRFVTMPPPSSGGVAIAQAFGIIERLSKATGSTAATRPSDVAAAALHVRVEALKHAFADRARFLGDPAFADVPVGRLASGAYLDELAARFDPRRTLAPDDYGTRGPRPATRDDGGTTHLSVVDAYGNAVACTETLFTGFGSQVTVEPYGFVLNNTLGAFTPAGGGPNVMKLIQSDANLPRPGRRPLASMTPTVVLDRAGRVELVAGGAGGPRIISGVFHAIDRALSAGATAREAVAAPRFHHQWQPDVLQLEDGLFDDATLVESLKQRGHQVERVGAIANVQLIRRTNAPRGWDAACDPRKGGAPAGF